MAELDPLLKVVTRVQRRVRFQRAIEGLTASAAGVFAVATLARVLSRLAYGTPGSASLSWLGLSILAAAVAWVLPVSRDFIATRIDQAHALHDRVRTALDFAARSERSGFMDAAIRDALALAHTLSPERAAPWSMPRARHVVWLAALAWVASGYVPVRAHPKVSVETKSRARILSPDELLAFQEELATLANAAVLSPEAAQTERDYRALLARIARGELDRVEAIEALLSLEKKLMNERASDQAADRAALDELAKELAKADQTLARTLTEQKPVEASEALQALAQKLSRMPKLERSRLEEALSRIKRKSETQAEREKRKAELESLLKRREQNPPQSPEEKRLLDRDKRELERLRRESAEAQKQSRELERLQRDLAEAAKALGQNQNEAAQDAMKRGAEDLKRFGEQQRSEEQQQALSKQLAQLRELLQRQREEQQGGGEKKDKPSSGEQRRQRFSLRASGQDPNAEEMRLMGPKGGESGQEGAGEQGEGADGKQGKAGKTLQLGAEGEGSAELELPGTGVAQGQRKMATDEHGPRTRQTPTDLEGQMRDSQLSGAQDKGPTRSEVILDAADRGFATAAYRKVYGDYRSHAEEVLDQDEIPSGYRFYVRRYFQLIRPREERSSP